MRYAALIMFLLSALSQLLAQSTDKLRVGDPAPQIKVYKWLKGSEYSAIEKGKVHVVEFGATWCKPCYKVIPELTALARKYDTAVNVIGIFVMEYSSRADNGGNEPAYLRRVEEYVKDQGTRMQYSVAVDGPDDLMEKSWIDAAGKTGVPHTFVIDRNGMIAWIGTNVERLEEIVDYVLSREYSISEALRSAEEAEKSETPYDPYELLLIDGNGGNDRDFLYRSVLCDYKGDIRFPPPLFISNFSWANTGSPLANCKGRVQATGATLLELYQLAYGDTLWNQVSVRTSDGVFKDTIENPYEKSSYGRYWHEPLLEVKDRSPFQTSYRSSANKFNYSLKVPVSKGTARYLQEAMQRDLKTYFGYRVSVEEKMMTCWRLTAGSDARRKLETKTPGMKYRRVMRAGQIIDYHNALIRDVIAKLGSFYGYGALDYGRLPKGDIGPFIDDTGIEYEIDFRVKLKEVDDFAAFRTALEEMGLFLEKSERKMKVVVIRDDLSGGTDRKIVGD